MLVIEEWRDTVKSGYEVSSFGRVRSNKRTILRKDGKSYPIKETILKQQNCNGYLTVDLKEGRPYSVHRLVGHAFLNLDFKDSKQQINHIDGNKTNNFLNNLEVCDSSYNNSYEYKFRGKVVHNKGISRFNEQVKERMVAFCALGFYQRDIAKLFKTQQSTVSNIVNRRRSYGEV